MSMMVVAHVSDLHLDGGARSAERAARVIAYLNRLPGPIDAVLVTGDIADHRRPDEYEAAAALTPRSRAATTACSPTRRSTGSPAC